jgi:DNA-binding CsgD family transcriptional regulator
MQLATARSHLKAVFRKLGVNRQQDLVRLLTSLSSLTPLV